VKREERKFRSYVATNPIDALADGAQKDAGFKSDKSRSKRVDTENTLGRLEYFLVFRQHHLSNTYR
jgi:hypothetical protein